VDGFSIIKALDFGVFVLTIVLIDICGRVFEKVRCGLARAQTMDFGLRNGVGASTGFTTDAVVAGEPPFLILSCFLMLLYNKK